MTQALNKIRAISAVVKDRFAVNSTGEIFSYSESAGVSGDPTQIRLTLIIKKTKTGDDSTTNVALHKKLLLYPYGGVKIEK